MEKKLKLCKENTTVFPFSINKEIDTWLPQEERVSFPKSFSYLRKKLQIKQSRKTHIDSILKKCKARFFKAISDCIKQCVKIQIKKFPQSFITNISIEYNKYILKLTVSELYHIFNLSNDGLDESNENCFFSGTIKDEIGTRSVLNVINSTFFDYSNLENFPIFQNERKINVYNVLKTPEIQTFKLNILNSNKINENKRVISLQLLILITTISVIIIKSLYDFVIYFFFRKWRKLNGYEQLNK